MRYLILLRPQQWIKNLFVFAAAFFAGQIFALDVLAKSVIIFLVFCCFASSVYIINDFIDKKQDQLHPLKKYRPLVSGKISTPVAILLLVALVIVGGVLMLKFVPQISLIIIVYVVLNLLYSLFLKQIALVDIFTIAVFYLLRVLAGGLGTDIFISRWLILCAIFVALFLVIAKRKAEFQYEHRRIALEGYNAVALDHLFTITAALTLITYSLYSVLGAKSPMAVYSVLPVSAGIFRYLMLAYDGNKTESAEKVIVTDKIILVCVATWLAVIYFSFYNI